MKAREFRRLVGFPGPAIGPHGHEVVTVDLPRTDRFASLAGSIPKVSHLWSIDQADVEALRRNLSPGDGVTDFGGWQDASAMSFGFSSPWSGMSEATRWTR